MQGLTRRNHIALLEQVKSKSSPTAIDCFPASLFQLARADAGKAFDTPRFLAETGYEVDGHRHRAIVLSEIDKWLVKVIGALTATQ